MADSLTSYLVRIGSICKRHLRNLILGCDERGASHDVGTFHHLPLAITSMSKSQVAFFIALEIYAYQTLCLWGSGFAESNRILLCGGMVTILYFAFAVRALMRLRTTIVLSLITAFFLGAWALHTFGLHDCGIAGGNGLFYRDFFSGDVVYCMDSLFHSTIVESIKNYVVPSTLLCPIEGMSYHVGADWIMAGIAKIIGVSGFAMIGYIYPIIFLPLISALALVAIQRIRLYLGADPSFSLCDAFFFLFFMLLPGFSVSLFVYFVHSETCLMGALFLLIDLALLPKIDAAFRDEVRARRNIVLFVLIPLLLFCTTFSKISAGYAFLSLVGGLLLWHVKWRNISQSVSGCIAGMSYLMLFACMYLITGRDQTPIMSSDYVYHLLEFGYRCVVCYPVISACLFLPMISLLIPAGSPAGKRIRFAFFLALVASYFVYVFLRVYGGSEVYFWVNCHLLTLVYFIAAGAPMRFVRFCSHGGRRFLLFIMIGLFVAYVLLPVGSVSAVVKDAFAQPRPNLAVLQSQRYLELEKARQFIKEKGPGNVMAYVTKDYWTELSSHERMSKAYVFAVQAYLGVPVLGPIKSDSQHVYVRNASAWTPIRLPAAYALDRYQKSPMPEYSEDGALSFAMEHGFKYLLVCGKHDAISVREVIR